MKLFKVFLTSCLTISMLATVTGCATKEDVGSDKKKQQDVGQKDTKEEAKPKENKLTYWTPYIGHNQQSLDEHYGYQKIQEDLGVDIEFFHPPKGQAKEQLNIMIASDELYDVMEYTWLSYPGGPTKILAEGFIQPLDINNAPNLKKVLDENPEVDKQVKTDDGQYYSFPTLMLGDYAKVCWGIIVRDDVLSKMGETMPTTIDEWYNLLKKVKEQTGMTPICIADTSLMTDGFIGAYNTRDGFYQLDGKVYYGPLDPGYKDFLIEMNKWFEEGLLDPDIGTIEDDQKTAKILSDKVFATLGYVGSGIGQLLQSTEIEGFDLAGAPYPTLEKGQKSKFANYANSNANGYAGAITKDCKNIEAAYKVLDYGYSPEGQLVMNFGIEGESYEMVDGKPVYTELITKNPDGLTMAQAMGQYIRASQSASMLKTDDYMLQYLQTDQQKEALTTWMDTDAKLTLMPPITMTPEESGEYARIINDINTTKEAFVWKLIRGEESFDNYDKFIETLKGFGIDKAIEIQQAALDRYNSR